MIQFFTKFNSSRNIQKAQNFCLQENLTPEAVKQFIEDYFYSIKNTEVPTIAWPGLFIREPGNKARKARCTVLLVGPKSESIANHLEHYLKTKDCLIRPISDIRTSLEDSKKSLLRCVERDVWYRKVSMILVVFLLDSMESGEGGNGENKFRPLTTALGSSSLLESYVERGDLIVDYGIFHMHNHEFLPKKEKSQGLHDIFLPTIHGHGENSCP